MTLKQRSFVAVKTNARETHVEQINETHFSVHVTAPPVDGKANVSVTKSLASFLGIAPSRLVLVKGATSRWKVFQLC